VTETFLIFNNENTNTFSCCGNNIANELISILYGHFVPVAHDALNWVEYHYHTEIDYN